MPASFDALLIVDIAAAGLVGDVEIAVFGRADSLVPRLAPELRRVNPHTVDVRVREVCVALPRFHSAGDGLTFRKCAVGVNVDVAEFAPAPRVNLVERVVVVRVHAPTMREIGNVCRERRRVIQARHLCLRLVPPRAVVSCGIIAVLAFFHHQLPISADVRCTVRSVYNSNIATTVIRYNIIAMIRKSGGIFAKPNKGRAVCHGKNVFAVCIRYCYGCAVLVGFRFHRRRYARIAFVALKCA